MWTNSQKTSDLVTFTEEILNGKLHFLRSATKFCLHDVHDAADPLSSSIFSEAWQ